MKSTKQEKIKVIVVNPPTKEESKKQIKMEDLVQSAINYLYDVFTNKNYVTDDDIKLFEIIYKD